MLHSVSWKIRRGGPAAAPWGLDGEGVAGLEPQGHLASETAFGAVGQAEDVLAQLAGGGAADRPRGSDSALRQDGEIARLTKRVELLLAREAEREAAEAGTVPLADQKPPHW